MRLIDTEKAWKTAQRIYSDPVLLHAIENVLDSTTTVDAVAVVRCNWIPVSERKPHYGQEVIVYGGNYLKACVTTMRFWDESHVNWVGFTHWMPLPEPPKEDHHET